MNELQHERWTRSNGYDAAWVYANQMGPNALWLLEALLEIMPITDDHRGLDLGCGRAMTSIFLAEQIGAEVTAADYWIPSAENQARIDERDLGGLITAVDAEAHQLPFEHEQFDFIVSLDAYQYFGTDDLYLGYLRDYVRPGGSIGIVVPSYDGELDGTAPAGLEEWWEWEYCCFHSPLWWRRHWEKTGLVTVTDADWVPGGHADWVRFLEASQPHLEGWRVQATAKELAMLQSNAGGNFGFTRMRAYRNN